MLILPADLEEVEEIGCGGVNGDEIFMRLGNGFGEVCYFEVTGTLRYMSKGCVDHSQGIMASKEGARSPLYLYELF